MYVHERNYDFFSIMILQYIVKKILLWSVLCHFIESILCHGGFWPLLFSCDINIIIFDQRSTIVYNRVFNFFSRPWLYLSKNRSLCTVWEAVVQNCCRQHPMSCGRNSRLLYYHDRPIKLLLYWKFCRILIVVIFSTFVHYHSCSCRLLYELYTPQVTQVCHHVTRRKTIKSYSVIVYPYQLYFIIRL